MKAVGINMTWTREVRNCEVKIYNVVEVVIEFNLLQGINLYSDGRTV